MVAHSLGSNTVSRRALFRGSAYAVAGGALVSLPFGRELLAHDVSDTWPNVAAKIEQYVRQQKVPNMVASFGWGEKDPHSVARGGLKFGRTAAPAGLDSLYRIYSMTKPITGMAVMMLIEEGKLGLDQPLAEIIPAFEKMKVLKNARGPIDDVVPAECQITIRHLLTHTAGFSYDITAKGPLLEAYLRNGVLSGQVSRIPIPGLPNAAPAPGLKAMVDRLATMPLAAQPGTKWIYSTSIDVLGRVIEVVSGESFDAFLQTRMFDPCGMDSTWFRVPQSEVDRYTDNYGILAGMPIPVDPGEASIFLDKPPILWGGSGLVSSPRDYDRFLKMLLGNGVIDGKRVMGAAAVRMGTSNLLPEGAITKGSYVDGQGFGAGGRVVGRTYGWGGAAGTLASVDFENNLRAGLFVQYMPSDAYPIRAEFIAALAKDLGGEAKAAALG
ncbi:serine hydrolase [Altererythrobacter arenosus]|uniref:Serine hydrolase n=1 Tax=Altererythrobacter arenosus TaxID=3032592 RepID=A0ABY8FNE9_9SPHN|nr:serine hydrolase domain-containing protein [Altererythrobacter sp. CAU 1644]WFL76554.1 serine hydrolase [Altererythrobacter sp. CAU 1644]